MCVYVKSLESYNCDLYWCYPGWQDGTSSVSAPCPLETSHFVSIEVSSHRIMWKEACSHWHFLLLPLSAVKMTFQNLKVCVFMPRLLWILWMHHLRKRPMFLQINAGSLSLFLVYPFSHFLSPGCPLLRLAHPQGWGQSWAWDLLPAGPLQPAVGGLPQRWVNPDGLTL